MVRVAKLALLFSLVSFGMVVQSPAPLVYRPGEGWIYEPVGGEEGRGWTRERAQDQLTVAKEAFDSGDFGLAGKAARRVVARWPLSDYAPEAQYLLARSYHERDLLEKAFKEYQTALEKYPRTEHYETILLHQKEITDEYLAGRWFRLWNYIPLWPSKDRTADMYAKIVQNGPYSDIAPEVQMLIGETRERQEDYPLAVSAYIRAADRYHDQPQLAADALYKAAEAYLKQAQSAEYDQGVAGQAIDTFTDFFTLYPTDPRAPQARQEIRNLRQEQARGAYEIGRFYEKRREWRGAMIYFNEVLVLDPQSPFAEEARERIARLEREHGEALNADAAGS